jgi:hypothetical protein
LTVGSTRLIFQEEIVFEKVKIRRDCKVNLTGMDENGNLEDGIEIQMNEFDFDVVETAKKITAGKPESPLEECFGDHNLISVWSGDFVTHCRPPLDDGTGRKKMVGYQFTDLILIDSGGFEHFEAQGGHCWEIDVQQEEEEESKG